jgi:hypothetical protein
MINEYNHAYGYVSYHLIFQYIRTEYIIKMLKRSI